MDSARDIRQAAREIVERTRREQGLPEKVDDPLVCRKVARIVRTPTEAPTRPTQAACPERVTLLTSGTASQPTADPVAQTTAGQALASVPT